MANKTILNIHPGTQNHDEANLIEFYTEKNYYIYTYIIMYIYTSTPKTVTHRDSPGKNTGVDCHALLQGIFLAQESNPGLPHCRWILLSSESPYTDI